MRRAKERKKIHQAMWNRLGEREWVRGRDNGEKVDERDGGVKERSEV